MKGKSFLVKKGKITLVEVIIFIWILLIYVDYYVQFFTDGLVVRTLKAWLSKLIS